MFLMLLKRRKALGASGFCLDWEERGKQKGKERSARYSTCRISGSADFKDTSELDPLPDSPFKQDN